MPQLSNRYTISDTPHVSITPAVDDEDADEPKTPIRAINGVRKALVDSFKPIPRKPGTGASTKSGVPSSIGNGSDIESDADDPDKVYLLGIKDKAHAQQVAILALVLSRIDEQAVAHPPSFLEAGK